MLYKMKRSLTVPKSAVSKLVKFLSKLRSDAIRGEITKWRNLPRVYNFTWVVLQILCREEKLGSTFSGVLNFSFSEIEIENTRRMS